MDWQYNDVGDLLSSDFDFRPVSQNQSSYDYQVDLLGDSLFDYDVSGGEVCDRRSRSEEREVFVEAEEEEAQAPRVYERYFDSSSDEEYYPTVGLHDPK